MKTYLLVLLSSLLSVAAFNIYEDASLHWTFRNPLRNWKAGEYLTTTDEVDNRVLRKFQIESESDFGTVIFGSSRSFLAAEIFGSDSKSLGVSSVSIEDHIGTWQKLLDENKKPKKLYLFLDPWVLNESLGSVVWQYSAKEVLTWSLRNRQNSAAARKLGLSAAKALFSRWYYETSEVLSYPTLKASLNLFASQTSQFEFTSVSEKENFVLWNRSGKPRYPASTSTRAISEVAKLAEEYAGKRPIYNLHAYQVSESAKELVQILLRDMAARGTEVTIVIPPYHPITYEKLQEYQVSQDALAQLEAFGKSLSSLVKVCGSTNPKKLGIEAYDFFDGMHMHESGHKKLFAACQKL